jgi:6-phosphogluconolactonase (cycloisomerase 2 family)
VCDLGCDKVFVYGFDDAKGALTGSNTDPRHLALPKGSGPRHLEFHPSKVCQNSWQTHQTSSHSHLCGESL